MMPSRPKGFTLLELMIVVVIIAILTTLAVYNYGRYGYRSRRSDAQDFLHQIASAEERYYSNHNVYTTTLADIGITSNVSPRNYYTVTAANGPTGDTSSYLLTATPQTGQPQAGDIWCSTLSLDSRGAKVPAPGTAVVPGNGSCW